MIANVVQSEPGSVRGRFGCFHSVARFQGGVRPRERRRVPARPTRAMRARARANNDEQPPVRPGKEIERRDEEREKICGSEDRPFAGRRKLLQQHEEGKGEKDAVVLPHERGEKHHERKERGDGVEDSPLLQIPFIERLSPHVPRNDGERRCGGQNLQRRHEILNEALPGAERGEQRAHERIERILPEAGIPGAIERSHIRQKIAVGGNTDGGDGQSRDAERKGGEPREPAPVPLYEKRENENGRRRLEVHGEAQRQGRKRDRSRIEKKRDENQIHHVDVDLDVAERPDDRHVDDEECGRDERGEARRKTVTLQRRVQQKEEREEGTCVQQPADIEDRSPAERHERLEQGRPERRIEITRVKTLALEKVGGRLDIIGYVAIHDALSKKIDVEQGDGEEARGGEGVARIDAPGGEQKEKGARQKPRESGRKKRDRDVGERPLPDDFRESRDAAGTIHDEDRRDRHDGDRAPCKCRCM